MSNKSWGKELYLSEWENACFHYSTREKKQKEKRKRWGELYPFCTPGESSIIGPRFLNSNCQPEGLPPFLSKKPFHAALATGSKIFSLFALRNQRRSVFGSLPTVWSCQGWQANHKGSSQACHNCTLMTSQAVGLSPAPNVKQQSPESVQIPEISPQSLDIICLTCLKWVLNVTRLKGPGS